MILETKYYKAVVGLVYHEGEAGIESISNLGAHIAVISSASVLKSVSGTFVVPEPVDDSASVRLLVVIKQERAEELSDEARYNCTLWALERSCELIEIDMGNLLRTLDEREKEGLPRVIEALQANMWSSMYRKDQYETSSDSDGTTIKVTAPPLKPSIEATSPAQVELPPPPRCEQDVNLIGETLFANEQLSNEELMLENFSDMIDKAKALRESVMSGKLTDEERRERAAAFAMQFATMLDEEESESD
jgi:hypothetical protein